MFLLIPVVLLGHLAIHIATINRLHGTGLPRPWLKVIDLVWYGFMLGVPLALAAEFLRGEIQPDVPSGWRSAMLVYCGVCGLAAVVAVYERIHRRRHVRTTPRLLANHTQVISVVERVGHLPVANGLVAFAAQLPQNEIMQLSCHEKALKLPRLPQGLEGLRITHLSDLHLTGQLTRDFYHALVDQANEWPADLVLVTGDIVEKVRCLDWVAETLGRLRSRYGTYFVLGNHELRIPDETRVRKTLTAAGMVDVGKRWEIVLHREKYPLLLAGNELPWFGPAADMSRCPTQVNGRRPLRIAMTHSPDQLRWARASKCDLMLCGHTHGGQVRLPWIGPILSPSIYGSRHASGTFYYEPTLLHVSRGIAGTRPLRWNCPPEIAHLTLS